MENAKVISLINSKILLFSLILALMVLAPFVKNQLITGSIVNSLLFISVIVFGLRNSFPLAILPSLISLSIGFLPVVLAPIVPFVILGNLFLMFVFSLLKEKNLFYSIILAAVLKFSILLAASKLIFHDFVVYKMMSSIQLETALIGGLIALIYYQFNVKKYDF